MNINITTKMSVVIPDIGIDTNSYIEWLMERIGDAHNIDVYEWWEND